MQGTFLGGAGEVGRLGLVLGAGSSRLLLDYGLAPEDPPQYPKPAPPVAGALVTHAHLDHAGMMPAIVHEYSAPIYGSGCTLDTAELLCQDCLKVHRIEGYGTPYKDFAIDQMAADARPIRMRSPFEIEGWEVQAENAGHIPGSCMYRLQSGGDSILFTGDINTTETQLVDPAEPIACDTLIMEGTYAGEEHEPRHQTESEFKQAVRATVERGGTCIIPAFAVGRTQEVLLVLDEMDIDNPVYLDGMGSRVTELFLRHPFFLKDADRLERVFDQVNRIRGDRMRRQATEPGNIVVTTSGMVEGGPVISHLKRTYDDPSNSVLLTGYQVEGTGGRRLVEENRVDLDGEVVDVNAQVDDFDFSGHAGHSDLVEFAEGCRPETIVLCHSDEPELLVDELESVAERVIAPHTGEVFTVP
jgi:putative mRNA 3-end processing factor